MEQYKLTIEQMKRVKAGVSVCLNWNGQGKVRYTVTGQAEDGLYVKDVTGRDLILPFSEYDYSTFSIESEDDKTIKN